MKAKYFSLLMVVLILGLCMLFYDEGVNLTQNEQKEIAVVYANMYYTPGNPINTNYLSFECYGKFNGTYVLKRKFGAFTQVLTEYTVGGVTFSFSDDNQFIVYSGCKFYTLPEAYDMGLLTHLNLVKVKYRFLTR